MEAGYAGLKTVVGIGAIILGVSAGGSGGRYVGETGRVGRSSGRRVLGN